jgi:hypothetical protein
MADVAAGGLVHVRMAVHAIRRRDWPAGLAPIRGAEKLLYFSGGRMVLWGLHIVPGLGTSPFEMLGWGTTPSLTSMP